MPIDWGDLELAFTTGAGEFEHYLDVETGVVHMVRADQFIGDEVEGELTAEAIDEGLARERLLVVERPPSSVRYEWMAEFAGSVGDRRLRGRLDAALGGRRPFRRFKDVLADSPRERERWFAFEQARLQEAMRQWLAENDIEATTEPPHRPAP